MLQQSDRLDECSMSAAESAGIAGIRHDLSEIGGKFRTGISKLSNHKGVSEFTKIASNFLQFGREENESLEDYSQRGVVGVTEEVVLFARDIAVHPETWLDFPLPDEDDEDDFDISDAQQEHALAIECLAPRLAALRIELCPGYMSEGSFWKIYFVLLHPRICRHDAELLSTPQIMMTRMMLTQELQHRAKEMGSASSVGTTNSASEVAPTDQSESLPVEMSAIGSAASSEATIAEIPIIGSAVAEEVSINKTNYETSTSSTSKGTDLHFEDGGDDWLKEENADTAGVGGNHAPIANDEDVSFSDLEDDDYDDDPGNHQKIIKSFHGRSSYPQNGADTININTEHCDTNRVSGHIHGKKDSIDWLDFNVTDSA